jgi:hypothetical protein
MRTGGSYSDAADLLRGLQNVTRGEARARVRDARDVLPGAGITGTTVSAELPATARAVEEAAVSAEHVRVIQAVLALLPPHPEMPRAGLEADLADFARTLDPDVLRRVGRAAVAKLDPDGCRPATATPPAPASPWSLAATGTTRGWFDREAAAILRTALSPLTAPSSPEDGTRDERTMAERQGDAMVDLARRVLDAGTLPHDGGVRPHVTVTVPLEVLENRPAPACSTSATARCPPPSAPRTPAATPAMPTSCRSSSVGRANRSTSAARPAS